MKVLSVRLFLNVVQTDSRVRLAAEATILAAGEHT